MDDTEFDFSEEAIKPARELPKRLPAVVIAGRPNVGKSTLVNRIVGRRIAIVEEHPGVTRDRKELAADWRGHFFTLIDTGGVLDGGDTLERKVTEQALRAVGSADVVLFVLDSRTGLTFEDEAVARLLRRRSDQVIVVANKVDASTQDDAIWDLLRLGFGDPVPVSALHGRGVGDLLDLVVKRFEMLSEALASDESEPSDAGEARAAELDVLASVALVGRPNVGKSTLFNCLVGNERSVVHDVPGTTRDSIDTIVETENERLRFIDTAGLRRRSRIGQGSEYYSFVRSLSSIDTADVALLVIDATEGVTHQDQRLAERIDLSGSPVVIVLNKWELLSTEERFNNTRDVEDRLGFLNYAPILRISAHTGLGVHRLLPAIRTAIEAYQYRIPTSALNEAMKSIQSAHPPNGSRILYAVQGAINPPTITLFASRRLDAGYLRYIERSLRERFSIGPSPIELRVRLRGKG